MYVISTYVDLEHSDRVYSGQVLAHRLHFQISPFLLLNNWWPWSFLLTTCCNKTSSHLIGSLPSQNSKDSGYVLWLNEGRITIWQQAGKGKMRRLSVPYSLMDSYWVAWISESPNSEGHFRIFCHISGLSQDRYFTWISLFKTNHFV